MLKISDNRRFLLHEDGRPFFYLGDTAWELFHRLSREEADRYLQNRADKGFTVIQAVALAELDGLNEPNVYGNTPLHNLDPTRPNEAYFEHVDYVVGQAGARGLHIGMLPTWGDKWNKAWGVGPEIFTPDSARVYGTFLGERYRNSNILWILGGDRVIADDEDKAIVRGMAEGIKEGDGGRHLMSFHPQGGRTSSEVFHNDSWLDFNMYQTGHARDRDNYNSIAQEYALTPTKPCMDAEPGYEDHPNGFKPENGYLDDYDVRKSLWWALLAGAHGHTYGCHDIWQFWDEGRHPISWARTPWTTALDLPGTYQMQVAKDLLLSLPYTSRVPDQSLIVGDALTGTDHIQASRNDDGAYAIVYSASGQPFTVDTGVLAGPSLAATWIDPRTGSRRPFDTVRTGGSEAFEPPTSGPGCDWVLLLQTA